MAHGGSMSQERAAHNQALFREVKERLEQLNETFVELAPFGSWVCECADTGCVEQVQMTFGEYEALREHSHRFAIAPSDAHVYPEVERVVDRTERYWLVEKIEQGAAIAAERDQRRRRAGATPSVPA